MDTVGACSTPFGSSALSVVRVSGPKTKDFVLSLQKNTKKIKHSSPFLSSFLDEDGVVFDEGIITVFLGQTPTQEKILQKYLVTETQL